MSKVLDNVKSGGTRMTVLGVVAMILGVLCMLMPGITGLSVMTMVGVLVLLAGFVRMFWAFKAGTFGKGLLVFILGGLTVLAGIALLANPLLAAGVMTILLAIYFVADGIAEIAAGIGRSGWLVFAGIVSILLGIMLWRQFPLGGVLAIGILFGIKLFMVGLIMITGGSALRSLAARVKKA
jgi:uncharacterized membrane protein HdeD (DUF308 family)